MSNPLKSVIDNSLQRLYELNLAVNFNRWEEASILYELHNLPWHRTEYMTWSTFRDNNLDQRPATISMKIQTWKRAVDLGYTMKDLESLSEKFTFSTLRMYFATLNERVSIRELKKMDNRSMLQASAGEETKRNTLYASVHLAMSDEYTHKLMGILEQYGAFLSPTGRKLNISTAMEHFLDSM